MLETTIPYAIDYKKSYERGEAAHEFRLKQLSREIRKLKVKAVSDNDVSVLKIETIDKDLKYLRNDYQRILTKLNLIRARKRGQKIKFKPNGNNESPKDKILLKPGNRNGKEKKVMVTSNAGLEAKFTSANKTYQTAIFDMMIF